MVIAILHKSQFTLLSLCVTIAHPHHCEQLLLFLFLLTLYFLFFFFFFDYIWFILIISWLDTICFSSFCENLFFLTTIDSINNWLVIDSSSKKEDYRKQFRLLALKIQKPNSKKVKKPITCQDMFTIFFFFFLFIILIFFLKQKKQHTKLVQLWLWS